MFASAGFWRVVWQLVPPHVPASSDYVLIARPGLSEAIEARGFEWLRERVDEALRKAAA